jgi:hypothetical protein
MNYPNFKENTQATEMAFSQPETTVVSVRAQSLRPRYRNLKEWMDTPGNVYVGRGGAVNIRGSLFSYEGSMWGNPFKMSEDCSRSECIQQFEAYIRKKIEREHLHEALLSLKGKCLGCWCKPEACHGDVLVRLIEEYSALYLGESASSGTSSAPPAITTLQRSTFAENSPFCYPSQETKPSEQQHLLNSNDSPPSFHLPDAATSAIATPPPPVAAAAAGRAAPAQRRPQRYSRIGLAAAAAAVPPPAAAGWASLTATPAAAAGGGTAAAAAGGPTAAGWGRAGLGSGPKAHPPAGYWEAAVASGAGAGGPAGGRAGPAGRETSGRGRSGGGGGGGGGGRGGRGWVQR